MCLAKKLCLGLICPEDILYKYFGIGLLRYILANTCQVFSFKNSKGAM